MFTVDTLAQLNGVRPLHLQMLSANVDSDDEGDGTDSVVVVVMVVVMVVVGLQGELGAKSPAEIFGEASQRTIFSPPVLAVSPPCCPVPNFSSSVERRRRSRSPSTT